MNLEKIRQIPEFEFFQSDNFYKIAKAINVDFDFDEELFKTDDSYRSEIYQRFYEKVITSGNDEDKIKLLFSFRNRMRWS